MLLEAGVLSPSEFFFFFFQNVNFSIEKSKEPVQPPSVKPSSEFIPPQYVSLAGIVHFCTLRKLRKILIRFCNECNDRLHAREDVNAASCCTLLC